MPRPCLRVQACARGSRQHGRHGERQGGASCGGGWAGGARGCSASLLPARCMAFVSAATTQLAPTVSAARTYTRTTPGMRQSLGTPMPAGVGAIPDSLAFLAMAAHSIPTFLILPQNASAMGMPAAATLTWPCTWHLAT